MNNRSKITVKDYYLFGFKIDKNNPDPFDRVEYTDDCVNFRPAHMDFDRDIFDYGSWNPEKIWFLAENKPCMIDPDGNIIEELDPNDYTKKIDGSPSSVSDSSTDLNCMAKIPLVYLKQWEDANYEYVQISNKSVDSSFKAYAHTDESDNTMDYIWLSCFEGANVSSKLRSIKGLTGLRKANTTTEISYATANGSKWYTRAWSHRNLINMLLILMGKSTDSQATFGYGYYNGVTAESNYSPFKTGDGSDKGQFYGQASTVNKGMLKVFHIEHWWGQYWERIAGVVLPANGHIMVKMTAPYNMDGSGYTDTGVVNVGGSSSSSPGGYINKTKMSEYGMIPTAIQGSSGTYVPDGFWYNTSIAGIKYGLVGCRPSDGLSVGTSALTLSDVLSSTHWTFGVSLCCQK